MSYIPADPAFYERILAALDKHPFAATLVTIVIVVGIVSWAWQRRGARLPPIEGHNHKTF